MKAIVRGTYGPPEVLRLEEVETPVPREHEIRIRVRAASINLGDWELLTGRPRFIAVIAHLFTRRQRYAFAPGSVASTSGGPFAPKSKILGTDVAGEVDAVGDEVTQFRVGDAVFGMVERFGAFAEYVCAPESAPIAPKPPALTFEQAAALPQATHIALQAMRDRAQVRSGQSVLVNGAGGGAGTLAVQLAKMYGATVTGVDGPTKQDLMRSVGADHVIDYTTEEFTRNGERYDAILDMAMYRGIFEGCRSLKPTGIYMLGGGSAAATLQSLLLGPVISTFDEWRIGMLLAASRRQDLIDIGELCAQGKISPVIDRAYPVREAAEALRRVGTGLGLGNVLILP